MRFLDSEIVQKEMQDIETLQKKSMVMSLIFLI